MSTPHWKDQKVLLVDDDQSLRSTLAATMLQHGLEVTQAEDGISAKSLLSLQDFQLILSDIRMPNFSGIELLHHVKRTKPTKVVLMTGFAEILAAKEAHDLGASGFLAKPFSQPELVEVLKKIFGEGRAPPQQDLDSQFIGMRLEEFITGKEILYDIYIRISSTKYIKVAQGGESIAIERIQTYKEKGLSFLYLKKDDFRRYLGFTANLAVKVAALDQVESSKKLRLLTQVSSEYMKDLYLRDIEPMQFQIASDLVSTTLSVAGDQNEVMRLFEALQQQHNHLYRHSLAVSLYSVLLSKAIGWKSPRTTARVSLCGLMHDIGKKELPHEMLDKPRFDLDPEELKELATHTSRGMEILNRLPGMPEEVAIVALQHHEDCKGLGYPQHLTKNKIVPVARLVGFVNAFCDLVFPSPGYEWMEPLQALERLAAMNGGRYDEEFVTAMKKLLAGDSGSLSPAFPLK